MLDVRDLHASVAETGDGILRGIDFTANKGEIHALMGPNGGGKSTFANVLSGRPDYEVTQGDILFEGESLLGMTADERAVRGLFMAFQYPAEIPGVRPWNFMKAAVDAKREFLGEEKLSVRQFSKLFDEKVEEIGINPELMKRSLNEGFSGGEKKRNEMVQLAILQPKLAILDETDSGLDVDALRNVSEAVNRLRSPDRTFILVTHYQRLLTHVEPDYVHILVQGRIVRSGGPELAHEVERTGYENIVKQAAETGA